MFRNLDRGGSPPSGWGLHFRDFLHNPYHYSATIVARTSVCCATILWSLIVLYKPDALTHWPGATVIGIVGEDLVAAFLFLIASVGLWRVLRQSRPVRFGVLIYGAMALLWVYSLITLCIAIYAGETSLRPGQFACVSVVTVLSLFAFIANPKKRR